MKNLLKSGVFAILCASSCVANIELPDPTGWEKTKEISERVGTAYAWLTYAQDSLLVSRDLDKEDLRDAIERALGVCAIYLHSEKPVTIQAVTMAFDEALNKLSRVLSVKFKNAELVFDDRNPQINTTTVMTKIQFLHDSLMSNQESVNKVLRKEQSGCSRCFRCLDLWGAGCKELTR